MKQNQLDGPDGPNGPSNTNSQISNQLYTDVLFETAKIKAFRKKNGGGKKKEKKIKA